MKAPFHSQWATPGWLKPTAHRLNIYLHHRHNSVSPIGNYAAETFVQTPEKRPLLQRFNPSWYLPRRVTAVIIKTVPTATFLKDSHEIRLSSLRLFARRRVVGCSDIFRRLFE